MLKLGLTIALVALIPMLIGLKRDKTSGDTREISQLIRRETKKTQLMTSIIFFAVAAVLIIGSFIITDTTIQNSVAFSAFLIAIFGSIIVGIIRYAKIKKMIDSYIKSQKPLQ